MVQSKKEETLTVKEAISKASEFFKEVFGADVIFRLEEVDLENEVWAITVSMPESNVISFIRAAGSPRPRRYKVIKVDAWTGETVSIKNG